jgi:hypothetical protein
MQTVLQVYMDFLRELLMLCNNLGMKVPENVPRSYLERHYVAIKVWSTYWS